MLRHEFQPGKMIAGAVLVAGGVLYAGDARGAWQTPWFAVIPLVLAGLCLAAVVGGVTGGVRRRRRRARTGKTETGADMSG